MVKTITNSQYGDGNWFPILIGACVYVVMRKDNKALPINEIASVIGCDIHELGRMVTRVVNYLELKLPDYDIVSSFERAIRTCPSFTCAESLVVERMLKQGVFLVQCLVKWFVTTGRRPLPVVVAVLVFVAELNGVEVRMEDVARELNVAVITCRLRYKELLERLVEVAQVLPWGKDVTVKNIVRNASFVIQYMEIKSMSKRENPDKNGGFDLDLDDLVGDCLSKRIDYWNDDVEHDSQYFEGERSPTWSVEEMEKYKISHECLSLIYLKFLDELSDFRSNAESGKDNRRKRKRGFDLVTCTDWWKGKSELSKKLFLKQILEKDVGLNAMPPSFVSGCLAYKRRRKKIQAAKLRIEKIMNPSHADSECVNVGKKRRKTHVEIDWEDFVIETLLLHQVKEGEIEKGHYNTLLDLHVFNSGTML